MSEATRRRVLALAVGAAGGACGQKRRPPAQGSTEPSGSEKGRFLRVDLPGLHIGIAEKEEGPTGCTVFWFPEGARCARDVRGGSVGDVGDYAFVHAVCFAGGSLLGLEATAGVVRELHARERDPRRIPLVTGAIIYDLFRGNTLYPDRELGAAALKAARPGVFPLGRRGAGRNAGCGGGAAFAGLKGETSGQGGSFRQLGAVRLAVFTVVNALGALVNRQGQVVRGHRDPKTGARHHYHEVLERAPRAGDDNIPERQHTTLTLVVTNQAVQHLEQLAKQVHTSMGRAIQPFHTEYDGDLLLAVSTGQVTGRDRLSDVALGVAASELAWDAVLACYEAG
jgi:L-aminopeptidase/D-esterase-like protein